MKKTQRNRLDLAALLILALCCPWMMGALDRVDACAADSDEAQAVMQAAQDYLNAEVRRDLPKVFSCLAPSSVYRTTYDYAAYLTEAQTSPVRIHGYKIVEVKRIRDNHDPQTYPRVEKFAQVEVDILVYYGDTHTASEVNFEFTFMKEGGKWYKG